MRLFLGQRTALWAYIRTMLTNDDRTEDVLQEVCMILLRKHEAIHDSDHLTRWLRTTARYEAFRVIREGKATAALSGEVLDALESEWDGAFDAERRERVEVLKGCLEKLTPYAQRLVKLRYEEGLTGQLLADRVERKVNAVYVALTRAHRALSDCVTIRLRAADRDVAGRI